MGIRHGGRQKGTPNRRTQQAIELMESLGLDPLAGMAEIALDPANPPELRGRMFAELAQYCYPKLRATEHTGADGGPFEATVDGSAVDMLRERLDKLADAELEALELVGRTMERIAAEKAAEQDPAH